MNTLALKTELAHLTISRPSYGSSPQEVLKRLRQRIKSSAMPLGSLISIKCTSKRRISEDIQTAQFLLVYEHHALLTKLTYFAPRKKWEISGCSFI
ncbi:MAG: hypothetical protein KI786_04630 [Mameliella sp.]|nr:hypothetical protein [Phaeodactylibacter sp.]